MLNKNYLKYDFYNGIVFEWKKYGIFFCYIFFLCARFIAMHHRLTEWMDLEKNLSFGDFMTYILKGMRFYEPMQTDIYIPDFEWILIYVYIAFVVNSYPIKDLYGYGQMVLIRSQKRSFWWKSKCIWNVFNIGIFYMIIILNSLIFALISGANRIMPQQSIQMYYNQMDVSKLTNGQFIFEVVVVPLMLTVALSLLQMVVSIVIHPVIGFVLSVSIYILSVYSSESWLMGNYLMLMRNRVFNSTSSINSYKGIICSIFLILVSLLTGYLRFRKLDIWTDNNE